MSVFKQSLDSMINRYRVKESRLATKHQASVAIILKHCCEQTTDCSETTSQLHRDEIEVLMIERAVKAGDPWSGHMAFPGGKREVYDSSSSNTAIRETFEEIGLHLKPYQRIGQLSDIITRHHDNRSLMKVTPWIFFLDQQEYQDLNIDLNHEAQSYHWIPLSTFESQNRQLMRWQIVKFGAVSLTLPLPHYHFKSKKIWGLSLMMIDELTHLLETQGYKKYKFRQKMKRLFS